MKKNIYFSITLYVLFFKVIFCSAQPTAAQQNLQKYWVYRERLKNFMIFYDGKTSGNCIPSFSRDEDHSGEINWNDSPWAIGYWIGTLAMEYDLLLKAYINGTITLQEKNTYLSQTKTDLYNAIEAVNRIDCAADGVWGCPNVDCPTNSLNGFSIADDVPQDFHQAKYPFFTGETGSDLLNEGLVPPPDGYRVKCINSAGAQYVYPREVSVDHVAGLFIGFSLVHKFIPTTETSNVPFTENPNTQTNNYQQEVSNIANRFINWIENNNWILRNRCTGNCVRGDCNPTKHDFCGPHPSIDNVSSNAIDDDPCPKVHDPCAIGSETGANAVPGAIGLLAANGYVQWDNSGFKNLAQDQIYRDAWDVDMNFIAADNPKHLGLSHWKVTLAAIGNIWNVRAVKIGIWPFQVQIILKSTTKQVAKDLVKRCKVYNWEHLVLMHRLFYGTQHDNVGNPINIANSFYECLLNDAPCRGYDGAVLSGENVEWGNGDRLSGNRDNPIHGYSSSQSPIVYLFYFNLYNEINYLEHDEGDFWQWSSDYYRLFKPLQMHNLALENIDKNSNKEYDKKNFQASNSITAHAVNEENPNSWYNIGFENSTGDYGRVVFTAGKKVDLLPGFDVGNGATLDANIDPTIGKMECYTPSPAGSPWVNPGYGCVTYEQKLIGISNDTSQEYDTIFVQQNILAHDNNISSTTALKQNITNNFEISIIPNPSKGVFNLVCKEALQNIEVRDVLGNLVYNKIVNNISVNVEIDISNQPPGIYFLKAQSGDKVYTEKVVVQ